MNKTDFSKVIRGQVIKLGDHIDTDLIYPARYVPLADPEQWPKHALEGIDPEFPQRIRQGDIIVCGKNFGCGSSRSQAVSCLKLAGIAGVVAASFSRVFFRNAINQGLPIIQSPQAAVEIADGQKILIDLDKGIIDCQDKRLVFESLPDFLMDILSAGGLINHTRRLLAG